MQNRPSHVIVAEFEVRPECYEKFVALARRFSVECVESEPGCWQFDVVELATPPNGVLFYEAYDDVAAFEAHCRTPHLAAFRDAFKNLIIGEKPLRQGSRTHTPFVD